MRCGCAGRAPDSSLVAEVEGVLHGAGRVVLAEVERVEVQPRRLDLGALGDLVAHRDEHVRDPLADLRDRVPGAARGAVERQRDVDGLLDEHPLVALGLEHGAAGVERLLHLGARRVHPSARLGPLRAGQRPQRAPGQQDGRAVAEVRGFDHGERGEVGRGVKGLTSRGHRVVERLRLEQGPGVGLPGSVSPDSVSPESVSPESVSPASVSPESGSRRLRPRRRCSRRRCSRTWRSVNLPGRGQSWSP